MKKYLCLFLAFAFSSLAFSQQQPFLLKNASLHLGNGQLIEHAIIVIDKDPIRLIAADSIIFFPGYEVIDLMGFHVYPYETLSNNDSKPFVVEFDNLLALHSDRDSTLTARVFHNQLAESFLIGEKDLKNLVVLKGDWQEKRGRTIRYLIHNGELIQRGF
jgi:hypothetical protein